MSLDRRQALSRIGSVVSAAALVSLPLRPVFARGGPDGPVAGLLLSLSGPHAAVGRSMERAAILAQAAVVKKRRALVFDTGGTPEGAAVAAQQAVKKGARVLLGPLLAGEVAAAVAAAAGRPVIAFTNDEAARGPGGVVFGITATQLTSGVLRYARSRGVRRIAVIGTGSTWSRQAVAAARRLQTEIGYDMVEIAADPTGNDAALLRAINAGNGVDAAFVAETGEPLIVMAKALGSAGVQILGAGPVTDPTPERLAVLRGAWLGSADPDGFADFARSYETANGGLPGTIAGLAFDATNIAIAVTDDPEPAAALLRPEGFAGVTGRVRFGAEGRVLRQVAVLTPGGDGLSRLEGGIWA